MSSKPQPEKGLPPGRPQPIPEDDPKKDGGDGDKPDDGRKPKFRLPFGGDADDHKKPDAPDIVKRHFAERRGYANFFYNETERDRVWKAISAHADLAKSTTWKIGATQFAGGNQQAKSALEITIDDARVEYQLASGAATLAVGDSLIEAAEPEGSGGLLAALFVWRRLLQQGPARFGDMHYQGAFPLPSLPDNYDVLFGRFGGVACRFFVDPRSGDLVSLEMQRDDAIDPCELFFFDYAEREGRRLPRRIEVRYGESVYAVLAPESWNFSAETAK